MNALTANVDCPRRDVGLACDRLPRYSPLSKDSFAWRRRESPLPCVLDQGHVYFTNLGRQAIELALLCAGINSGERVLLPAYHCIAMVSAVLRAGGIPAFYQIDYNAEIDLEDLAQRIEPGVRAVIAPYFFGFPQPMAAIRALCDSRGVTLIEDCCHALFGEVDGLPIGAHGHYTVASPWKFLPVRQGGCLVVNQGATGVLHGQLRTAGIRDSVKDVLNTVEYAGQYGRLRIANMLLTPLFGLIRLMHSQRQEHMHYQSGTDPRACHPEREEPRQALSPINKALIRRTDRKRVVCKRRDYYARLSEAWGDLSGARALYPRLPVDVVPQVFPLLVDNPIPLAEAMRDRRIPVIRFGEYLWDGMPVEGYADARYLSASVFQFPCHQELTGDEFRYMLDTVREVCGAFSGDNRKS